jgi:hyperosmotically inducible periplasmic protein
MKKLLLIPALCVLCCACNTKNNNNGNNPDDQNQSGETSADWEITTKVKAQIMSDSTISASARMVSVETTDGVVTLTGSVPTEDDMDRIVMIVQQVNGVVRVDNQMTVSD